MDPCRPPGAESALGSSAPTALPLSPGNSATSRWLSSCPLHMRPVAAWRAESEGTKTQNRKIWRSPGWLS